MTAFPDPAGFPYRIATRGAEQTMVLGRRVAELLGGGEIVLLHGDLGAGKTCFVQGVCAGLNVTGQDVVSPTFTLVNTYDGRLTVHHLDFYRVEPGHNLEDIGVPDLLDDVWDGQAVALIEWPAVLEAGLGADTPRVELLVTPADEPDARWWHLRGLPETPAAWIEVFGGESC